MPGSDATVVRIETEADGNGVYEAHMLKSDGSAVTVYFDKDYKVTSVDEGMGGPDGRHGGPNGPDAQSDTTATTANGA